MGLASVSQDSGQYWKAELKFLGTQAGRCGFRSRGGAKGVQKGRRGLWMCLGRSLGLESRVEALWYGTPQFKLRLVGVLGRGLGTAAHFSFLGF